MIYTVWWFESDGFEMNTTRHNVDFNDYEKAVYFKRQNHPGARVQRILDCPWHQSNAHPSYLSVMQDRMIKGKK